MSSAFRKHHDVVRRYKNGQTFPRVSKGWLEKAERMEATPDQTSDAITTADQILFILANILICHADFLPRSMWMELFCEDGCISSEYLYTRMWPFFGQSVDAERGPEGVAQSDKFPTSPCQTHRQQTPPISQKLQNH